MYPDLSYILHALIGTEPDNAFSVVKTFGLFLALSFLVAAYFLYKELKRKEAQGLFEYTHTSRIVGTPASVLDLLTSGIFGFILGAKLLYAYFNFPEFQADAVSVLFSLKGSLIGGIIGAAIFAGIKYWEKQREKLPKPVEKKFVVKPSDRVGDIVIVAAISGIIGAKIFAIIEEMDDFWQDPIGTFFSGSGLAIYGGLIGGFIGVFLYLKRYNIKPIHVMDATAPSLILAYGVGRMGCQFSGDGDWGIVAKPQPDSWFLPDWLWSFKYPHNVNKDGVPIEGCTWEYCMELVNGVYPTPIYETFVATLIFLFLWAIRKRIKVAGVLFFIYLIFNGIERYFIEKIRVNSRYEEYFNLTQAEIIAILFVSTGIIAIAYLWSRAKKQSPKTDYT